MSKQLLGNHQQVEPSNQLVDEDSECIDVGKPQLGNDSLASTSTSTNSHSEAETTDRMTQQHTQNLLKQLEEMRLKQSLNEQYSTTTNSGLFSDLFNPLQFSGYQFLMPQYPALASVPGFEYLNPYNNPTMMLPYFPELFKNLTQKRLELEQMQLSHRFMESNSKHKPKRKADSDDIQLKVPSYKPSVTNSLPDFSSQLADSLNHTAQSGLPSSALSSSPYLQTLPYQHPSPSSQLLQTERAFSSSKKIRLESPEMNLNSKSSNILNGVRNSTNIATNGNNGVAGKKRPKRGQYRKYDSELLAQAVRAVQRGEMSVHRAGTFFGVPHSTLEYKVKERHLLRKKKLTENTESKNGACTSTKMPSSMLAPTNISTPMDSNQSEKPSTTTRDEGVPNDIEYSTLDSTSDALEVKPSYTFPEMSSPASELLKKLQERAQKKAAEILNNKQPSSDTPTPKFIESLSN